jgi:fibronectin type 3 domain-containing protein
LFFFSLCSSLVVDNQTNDEPQSTTPTTIKKNLSNINSFEEWKQQQLHADLLSVLLFSSEENQVE